jgi:Abortive infection C-terminus
LKQRALDDIPDNALEQARMLENILLAACEGDRTSDRLYIQLRTMLFDNHDIKALLPSFVRTSRDLGHFWSYIKGRSAHWEPRRVHVRDAMTPVINYLEGATKAPVDDVASDVLENFAPEGVHKVWSKALERRHSDPEGAITVARTLLETVCKHVLDEEGMEYDDSADLPALYKMVANDLNIAPSQYTEDAFKRILGGATSVVEGLGSLRNKIGDAHGYGKKAVRPKPRHAQLAVNLAGAMATFIVETWTAKSGANRDVSGSGASAR